MYFARRSVRKVAKTIFLAFAAMLLEKGKKEVVQDLTGVGVEPV